MITINKICVLGSINIDLVIRVKDMPKEGETILSKGFEKISGGKGANQAVAAVRSGNQVSMIGRIGKDSDGRYLKNLLMKESINTNFIIEDDKESTGMAMITVNDNGNNSIVVISGANMGINDDDIDNARELIEEADIIISQFETTESATIKAFKLAKELGKITILNPAPAKKINPELLKYVDIIVPNETEAELLTGVKVENIDDAKKAAKIFSESGIRFIIITLGSRGAVVIEGEKAEIVDAFKVNAVDTTAAGDSFIGGLSSKLKIDELNFENIIEAVRFGNKVSSITVQRKGAQPSIATLKEVTDIYGEE